MELKVPNGEDVRALVALWPAFSSYALSFIYIGVY
ncbi:TMEM175 family protein [Methylocystis echinoides]